MVFITTQYLLNTKIYWHSRTLTYQVLHTILEMEKYEGKKESGQILNTLNT